MRICVIAGTAAILLVGCDSLSISPSKHPGGEAGVTGAVLAASIVFEGDELSRPQSIGVLGGWVLVGDVPRPHALHVIDRAEGRYLASWGREGRGPAEFLRLWGIQPIDGAGEAWLYDPSQTRFTRADVAALAAGAGDPLRRSVNLVGDLMPMSAVWLGDSVVVSSGMFTGGRLARYDREGRVRGVVGPLPPGRDGVPAQVVQHAYSGTLVRHPSGERLGILTRHADRFEIYTAEGDLVGVHRGPRGFEPVYEMQVRAGTPVMVSGDDLRFGYVEAVATGEHVYALYSGLTRGELPGRANFGGEVHVFDWNGNLLRILPLDQRALALAVSPDERTLYTIRHDPVPAVLKYDLPEMEKPR
jgi:hypothetical protein